MNITAKMVPEEFLKKVMSSMLSLLTILLFTQSVFAQSSGQTVPGYIQNAVNSSARSEAMTARDAGRHPAEILMLSGVKPGDRVLEFAGFGQYYTTMLAEIVGDDGEIHMFDLPYTGQRAGSNSTAFVASHTNTYYHLVDYNIAQLPQETDVVFNVLYYHDLPLNNIDTAELNKRIFDALKPGGVFLVIDHNAEPGSGTRDTRNLHRIDPQIIRQEILAAGFELVLQSDLLANPGDDFTTVINAPGIRGATDRTVFKFVKPE